MDEEQPTRRGNQSSSDQNCEMVILTDDDESMSEEKDEQVSFERTESSVLKDKSDAPFRSNDISSKRAKSADQQLSETQEESMSDRSCEVVVLTDDENTPEEGKDQESSIKPFEAEPVVNSCEVFENSNVSTTSFALQSKKISKDNTHDQSCDMIILTDDEMMPEENSRKPSEALAVRKSPEVCDNKLSESTKSSGQQSTESNYAKASERNSDAIILTDDMIILTDDETKSEVKNDAEKSTSLSGVERVTDDNLRTSPKISVDTPPEENCDMIILTDDEAMPEPKNDAEKSTPLSGGERITDDNLRPSAKISVDTPPEENCDMIILTDDEAMPEDKNNAEKSTPLSGAERVTDDNLRTSTKISVDTLSDENCDMIVLTDDEIVPEEQDSEESSSKPSEAVAAAKSPESSDNLSVSTKSSGQLSAKISEDNSADKKCDLITLTDDEIMPEGIKDTGKSDPSVNAAAIEKKSSDYDSKTDDLSGGMKSSDKQAAEIMEEDPSSDSDMVIITDDENVPEGEKSPKRSSGDPCKTSASDEMSKSAVSKVDDSDLFTKPKLPKPLNTPVEVIDIEAIREKKMGMGSSECVNPNCKFGSDLREAESFVTAYYNVKPKSGLRMCAECYRIAMNYADKLRNNLVKHKSIFDIPCNPDSLVVSLDLDSDDENEKEDERVNLKKKKLVKSAENYLNDSVMSVLKKFDYKFQLDEGSKKVSSDIDRIKAEFDSMKLEINDHTKNLKKMYEKIHGPYRPRLTHLKELQIVDCHVKPHGFKIPLKTPRVRSGSIVNPSGMQGSSSFPAPARPAVAMKKVTPFKFSNVSENYGSSKNISSSDIVQLAPSVVNPPKNLPNIGPLVRTSVKPNEVVYFMKSTLYGVWIPGKVVKISVAEPKHAPFKFLYKIRPEPLKKYQDAYRSVLGKFIAYSSPATVRLPIGTRVIAIFKEENAKTRNDKFYAGVVAEPPKLINKFRYLVFFDDGYAQYIHHEEIRVVCESSKSVWDDVLPDFKDFIRRYLLDYPERPMVKLQTKQMVKTEWNGKWWIARVMEIDSSLVKMLFDADRRVEWIYRGSTRLGPLFAAHKRQETGDRLVRGLNSNLRSRNLPYVEYTRQECDGKIDNKDSGGNAPNIIDLIEKRAVAKKSGTGKPVFQKPSERGKKDIPPPVVQVKVPSRIDTIDTSKAWRHKRFVPHQCGPRCVSWVGHTFDKGRGYGPLAVPLLFGFERVWSKVRASKGVIFYVAPCGRRLRNISEVHRYLRISKSEMTVDQFSFEEWVNCLTEFKITKYFNYIQDLSYGKEKQPISCVNYLDNLMPVYVQYITEREPREGVPLNLDPDFLVCCDCTDDCQDKEKCACWKLTMDNQKIIPGMENAELNQGYIYRRLPERIVTGIYECNSKCKCSKTSCLNRVVQHPLVQKLQLFKTEKKGWGIRCLHDIPIGSFICIYAGNLLTEHSANEEGKNYGDEYLAELDYIEVIERIKEDYEESVPSELLSDAEKTDASSNEDEEDDDSKSSGATSPRSKDLDAKFELKYGNNPKSEFKMMLRKKPDTSKKKKKEDKKKDDKSSSDQEKSSSKDDDDGDSDDEDRKGEGAPRKFNPVVDEDPDDRSREKSLRNLFGEDECVYVMDAKTNGNIGRYLNHSCEPNVFVQNVFVDTHDLRFPWVAFFALNYIPAGQELTWDYNYDVNSVPGKVLYCYCNSAECRGRLL